MPVEIELAPVPIFLNDVPLPMRATFFPLGFPLHISTNSHLVIEAARKSWGDFRGQYAARPVSLSLTVTDDVDGEMPPPPKFRAHQHLMSIVGDAGNQVMCDFAQGCAVGWVTRQMAQTPQFLRLHYLEASVMTLLVSLHLAPIHSALLTKNGVGVALCGESFAGKSTLAYACAKSGWTLVCDDGMFLIRNHRSRYGVGNPYAVRLREDAKDLFPELQEHRVALRPNGELGMEVRTAELPISTTGGCVIEHLVFLRRSAFGPASLNVYGPDEALAWLERTAFYGPVEVQAEQRQAYRRLLDAGLWELRYSSLSDAIKLLEQLGATA